MNNPYDFQEIHSPTTWDKLRLINERKACYRRRRQLDKRLFDAMEGGQEDAFEMIGKAYQYITDGAGMKSQSFMRTDPATRANHDYLTQLADVYLKWARGCCKERISHAMVIDTVVFGKSLKQVSDERRLKYYAVRRNFYDGLDLFLKFM